MILYFDTFVSNNPLFTNPKSLEINKYIRPSNSSYKDVNKVEIFSYTIESFKHDEFKNIFINVEFENINDQIIFKKRYLDLPDLKINFKRSSKKNDFINVLNLIDKNEWVFFSPNNDHPYISNRIGFIEKIELYANYCKKKYNKNVSIFYSHYTECLNFIKKHQYLASYPGNKVKLIDENNDFYLVEFDNMQYSSIQIFQADFLIKLFNNIPNNDDRVIRIEDISKYIKFKIPILSIIPKYEICRHYDTYIHTLFFYNKPISPINVPPLFVPKGFFENKIKIKYGYDKPYENFVNINPNKEILSFIDNVNGFDLLTTLNDLPYSWLGRIEEIDINPEFIENKSIYENRINKIRNPWGKISKLEIFINYIFRGLYNGKIFNYYIYFLNKYFWKYRIKKIKNV